MGARAVAVPVNDVTVVAKVRTSTLAAAVAAALAAVVAVALAAAAARLRAFWSVTGTINTRSCVRIALVAASVALIHNCQSMKAARNATPHNDTVWSRETGARRCPRALGGDGDSVAAAPAR